MAPSLRDDLRLAKEGGIALLTADELFMIVAEALPTMHVTSLKSAVSVTSVTRYM